MQGDGVALPAKIDGKLNVRRERGYAFDLGPSIATLPHLLDRLFRDLTLT